MRADRSLAAIFDYPIADILAAMPPEDSPLWEKERLRQQRFRVHSQTRSIIFAWLENDWQPGMPLDIQRPEVPEVLGRAVADFEAALLDRRPGTVVKSMLAEVPAGKCVYPHVDRSACLVLSHRCHLPVLTSDEVDLDVDAKTYHLQVGTVYELDNTRLHGVRNLSDRRRVHLICDVMP